MNSEVEQNIPNKSMCKFSFKLSDTLLEFSNIEDRLYEAGCDDALISFRDCEWFLDFTREAESLEDALISALMQMKKLNFKILKIIF